MFSIMNCSYGIGGSAIRWLRSYLSGRSQLVQVGQAFSEKLHLDTGTQQGTSCSCLVLALFIGDLPLWIESGLLVAYTDDVSVSVEVDNDDEL